MNIEVHQQTNIDFWKSSVSSKRVKPDLVVICNNTTYVIDTKWKRPDENNPDDNDLKQMLVYKLYYHADEAVLLYPCTQVSHNTQGNYHNELHYTVNKKNVFAINEKLLLSCRMGFLNLLSEGTLIDNQLFKESIKLSLGIYEPILTDVTPICN